ncbi:MAG: DUF4364 family protein [Oscillospiraceae bacterium]|jgi:hypothetical protein|nr:DUF4364 family protein [Oscillospiraceae bacterium]
MESHTFKAGTAPGSPDTNTEIKMLVLYCMTRSGAEADFAALHEALDMHGLVNYFALVESVDQLTVSGHLERKERNGACVYAITELGRATASEFRSALPPATRDKAASALWLVLKRRKRLAEVSVRERAAQGGFILDLAIPEPEGALIALSVFAPGVGERELIKKRFLNDPIFIYKGIMALLTGDRGVLGDLFPEKEKLF